MSIKVFYNKSCNICKTEINHYKKHCNNKIFWINVVNNKQALESTSKTYPELLRRLHVSKNGKIISGTGAFLEIWRNIPRYRIFYLIFKFKIFFMILNFFYEIAAYLLYIKNRHLLKRNEKEKSSN